MYMNSFTSSSHSLIFAWLFIPVWVNPSAFSWLWSSVQSFRRLAYCHFVDMGVRVPISEWTNRYASCNMYPEVYRRVYPSHSFVERILQGPMRRMPCGLDILRTHSSEKDKQGHRATLFLPWWRLHHLLLSLQSISCWTAWRRILRRE